MSNDEPIVGVKPPRVPLKSAQAIAAQAKKAGRPIPAAIQAVLDAAQDAAKPARSKKAVPAAENPAGGDAGPTE